MTFQVQSAFIAAIVNLCFAIYFIVKDRKNRLHRTFSYLSFNIFLWNLGYFFYKVADSDFWYRLLFLGSLFLPPSALHFTLILLSTKNPIKWGLLKGTYGISIGLFFTVWTPLFFMRAWSVITIVYFFPVLYLCLYLIYKRYVETTSATEKAKLKYMLIGGAIAITAGITDFLPGMGIEVPQLGNLAVIVYMYFISQSIVKYRLLDLHESIGRGIVLITLASITAGIYGALVLWIGNNPELAIFNTFVASLLILWLYEPIKLKIQDQANRIFLRGSYNLQTILNNLSRKMARALTVEELLNLVVDALKEFPRVTHASIYILEEGDTILKLVEVVGDHRERIPKTLETKIFLEYLKEKRGGLILEELERELEMKGLGAERNKTREIGSVSLRSHISISKLCDFLKSVEAQVCIPLISQDKVLGFCNLKDARSENAYSSQEIASLMTIANQAAIIIENCKIYETMKRKDRLVALGEMATGLAHEIRNPLGAIKGAAQYIQLEPSSEERKEFLNIIIEEVDRLNQVVSQFLDYARPFKKNITLCEIDKILEKTYSLIKAKGIPDHIKIIMTLEENLPLIHGDAEQIRQVFLNLMLNAIQAMTEEEVDIKIKASDVSGSLIISTTLERYPDKTGTYLCIKFADTGIGIPPDHLDKLFNPFFTTKKEGTGLGLAICHRIVEGHGGTISVSSQIGKGSLFVIKLPVQ
jgi:signal transduction histidine kinase